MKQIVHSAYIACYLAAIILLLNNLNLQARAPASAIDYQFAVKEAKAIIESQEHWQLMRGSGNSMEPLFGEGSLLLVEKASINQIRPGMVVVYRDSSGMLVAHNVERVEITGVQAKGINNSAADPELVTTENLIGVVFGYLHTRNAPDRDSLPVAVGKSIL